jgi:hypothetical protein
MSSNYFAQFDTDSAEAPADRAFDAPTERDPKLTEYANIFEAGIKREKNLAIMEAFGREVEAHPFFTMDDPSTVVSASLVGKPKESVATDAVLPQVRRGVGVGMEMLGQGIEQYTGENAASRGFQSFGQRQQDDAPERKVPSIYDIKGIKDFATWAWESAQEGVGTSAPAVVGGILGAPLGPLGVAIGVGVTSNVMGVGQMRNALEDERNEYFDRAERAKQAGNAMLEQWFTEEGSKLDPDKNRVIVQVAGTLIGAMDAFTPARLLMSGAPAHLVNELKTKTFRLVATHIAKRTAEGAATEGVTEATQAVVEIAAVLRAKGVTGAMDHINNIIDNRWRILDEAAAGMAGGTAFGVMGGVREVAGAGSGASEPPTSPLMDQAKQQAGTGNFFEQFDTPADKAAAQAPQQPAQPQQPQTAPTPAETSPSQPATTPAPATVDLTQGATEVVRTYGLPDDIVSGARLDNLYVRDAQLEEQLDLREVDLDLDVEMEDGTVTKQTVKMPARQALDMVDRRLKGMVAFIRCLES